MTIDIDGGAIMAAIAGSESVISPAAASGMTSLGIRNGIIAKYSSLGIVVSFSGTATVLRLSPGSGEVAYKQANSKLWAPPERGKSHNARWSMIMVGLARPV
ncbi:MAG: hypothetical protein GIW98_07090 [Candidatus Eremiobacteraeota bacterium]|nr:hypothetical protein [Candidatus Eremiobacteraeota bacterium]